MGSSASNHLETPWRKEPWGDNRTDLEYVKSYQPQNDQVKYVRVLLYGPVHAGKSTFISSVSSTVRQRMAIPALANANNPKESFTKNYTTHYILKDGSKDPYSFVFIDIMGLEERPGRGICVEDVKLVLKGHVKEDYKFKPGSPLSSSDPDYNPSPSLDDKVHVLVCVFSANTPEIRSSTLEKMRTIREAASDLGIPQIAVITNIDEACKETEEDLKNVYKSQYVKEKMGELSTNLGIPLNCMFPVKNYSKETDLDAHTDSLILKALRLMINSGDDFIKTSQKKNKTSEKKASM